jgi:hypothetical protein
MTIRTMTTLMIAATAGVVSACSTLEGHRPSSINADIAVLNGESCGDQSLKIGDGSMGLFAVEAVRDFQAGAKTKVLAKGFMTKAPMKGTSPFVALAETSRKTLKGLALAPMGPYIEINPATGVADRSEFAQFEKNAASDLRQELRPVTAGGEGASPVSIIASQSPRMPGFYEGSGDLPADKPAAGSAATASTSAVRSLIVDTKSKMKAVALPLPGDPTPDGAEVVMGNEKAGAALEIPLASDPNAPSDVVSGISVQFYREEKGKPVFRTCGAAAGNASVVIPVVADPKKPEPGKLEPGTYTVIVRRMYLKAVPAGAGSLYYQTSRGFKTIATVQ